MKNKLFLIFVLFLLVISIAYSAPAWKKTQPTTEPTKEIIIINQTVPAEVNQGINWEMIGVIITIIAGISGFLYTRKRKGATSKYLNEINNTYTNSKTNTDKCELRLLELKHKIENDFSKGKLNESSFDILDRRIDNYLGEIRKGIVNTKFGLSGEDKRVIDKVLEDGIVNKEEYNNISKLDLKGLTKESKDKLMKLLEKWKKK